MLIFELPFFPQNWILFSILNADFLTLKSICNISIQGVSHVLINT